MKKLVLGLALVASTSVFATGVKGGKIGVNFQYSGTMPSLGAWWHIVDMVAINPYVGYGFSSEKTTYTGGLLAGCGTATCTNTDKSNNLVLGIDVPIYLAQFNALNFFVAPGFSYTSSGGSNVYENTTAGTSSTVEKGSSPKLNFGLYAGLQIPILEQLHVFGKAGFDFGITSNSNNSTYSKTEFTTTRYSIGAIFYFN